MSKVSPQAAGAARPEGQLLHLVFGGELERVDDARFTDLTKLDIVGIHPNYRAAYDVWRATAHASVDNARTRYFIVHLHRLLDPGAPVAAGDRPIAR